MNKAFRFRIYPNSSQQEFFVKTFGCCRFIYNKMLADKIEYYQREKRNLYNTPKQYKNEHQWLKEVDSLALSNTQMNLQSAYNNFFRNPKTGFPKFKSKKTAKDSYTTNNQKESIRIIGNKIKLPKIGLVKIKLHRQLPKNSQIKSCTISRTKSNKYYISILCEYDFKIPEIILDKEKSLGLDYSSHNFYTDSQGINANYPKYYRLSEDKLRVEQRKLSKMFKGSSNYYKQKLKLARLSEHIANQRKDWMHKISIKLANEYDYICIEDLNLQNIAQSLKLGKSTNDNGFGMFVSFLKYKLTMQGKMLIKIDKWFPSSKMCYNCGCINHELKLSDREWDCDCGEHIYRDWNAAKNILREGLSQI